MISCSIGSTYQSVGIANWVAIGTERIPVGYKTYKYTIRGCSNDSSNYTLTLFKNLSIAMFVNYQAVCWINTGGIS
ncbi:hypothetical protein QVD17_09709 [Tagetes erecta]|uniref:Uncharacterized protein n=1 Tax=Tagetes erecta TaxID=13708 RepID=A0AAD8L1F4_TARER|nr:hypothetical protein QVD17_09709 [Tagetes erecta]